MRKTTALTHILEFGKNEERKLREAGKSHEAYQIEHARDQLNFALLKSIKNVREMLDKMINYTIDGSGFWHYDALNFVQDEYTRSLLAELKKNFEVAK